MSQLAFDFMLPRSNWIAPTQLPDLRAAKVIALDTENHDPFLKQQGAGWIHGEGRCVGVSVATDTGYCGYFPIGHQDGGNLDRNLVSAWLREQCQVSGRDYVFTNAFYDLGWLASLGVRIGGSIHDVSIRDTLLDEESPTGYGLEALGQRWLGSGKDDAQLNEAANAFGYRPKADLWKLHAQYVGRYAEIDALRTLQIFQRQQKPLSDEGLLEAANLESRLTPVLYQMCTRGIRVDISYAQQLHDQWLAEENLLLQGLSLSREDLWNPEVVKKLCRKLGIPIPEKDPEIEGSGSLDKNYLAAAGVEGVMPFLKARAINRSREIYLHQNLIQNSKNGRIHPQFIQMKSDEGGCRTPRMASKNPNAQQFPKRSTLFNSKLLRKCLIAEDGCQWAKLDYWSQEPIIQCHLALRSGLAGAKEIKEQFSKGIKLATFIEKATNGRCNYDQAKEVTLGRSYGMGKAKMSRRMGISEDECGEILAAFDQTVPYIAQLAENCSAMASARGFVRMPLGYQRRFKYWQPVRNWDGKFAAAWQDQRYYKPIPDQETAIRLWNGKIQRAYTYKAFNAMCQGFGAIQAKKALLTIAESIIMPTLPVHDEINSANITSEKQAKEMKEAMENSITMLLPARADLELGLSWQ